MTLIEGNIVLMPGLSRLQTGHAPLFPDREDSRAKPLGAVSSARLWDLRGVEIPHRESGLFRVGQSPRAPYLHRLPVCMRKSGTGRGMA